MYFFLTNFYKICIFDDIVAYTKYNNYNLFYIILLLLNIVVIYNINI